MANSHCNSFQLILNLLRSICKVRGDVKWLSPTGWASSDGHWLHWLRPYSLWLLKRNLASSCNAWFSNVGLSKWKSIGFSLRKCSKDACAVWKPVGKCFWSSCAPLGRIMIENRLGSGQLIAHFFNGDHSLHSACVTVWTWFLDVRGTATQLLLTSHCNCASRKLPHLAIQKSTLAACQLQKLLQTQYLQRNWMSLEQLERNLMQSLRLVPCAELGYKMLGILPSLTCCTCSELMTSVQLQCHQVERWMQTLRTSELFSGP